MVINKKFNERQIELLKKIDINLEKSYSEEELEELEDKVYNAMMDRLDKNQDFTPIAEEYENILDIIVDIENNL